MQDNVHLISRRTLLTQSAITFAALSLPTWIRGEEPARTRRLAVTLDDGPATGTGSDLESFRRIANALRETFVSEKVPAIMFVNERQLQVDGQRDARVDVLRQWLDAGLDV